LYEKNDVLMVTQCESKNCGFG